MPCSFHANCDALGFLFLLLPRNTRRHHVRGRMGAKRHQTPLHATCNRVAAGGARNESRDLKREGLTPTVPGGCLMPCSRPSPLRTRHASASCEMDGGASAAAEHRAFSRGAAIPSQAQKHTTAVGSTSGSSRRALTRRGPVGERVVLAFSLGRRGRGGVVLAAATKEHALGGRTTIADQSPP